MERNGFIAERLAGCMRRYYESGAGGTPGVRRRSIHAGCPAAPSMTVFGAKVRVFGVTTLKPTALATGVPTIAEAVPGYEMPGWYGVLAPLRKLLTDSGVGPLLTFASRRPPASTRHQAAPAVGSEPAAPPSAGDVSMLSGIVTGLTPSASEPISGARGSTRARLAFRGAAVAGSLRTKR